MQFFKVSFFTILILSFFVSCGYRPSSYYAKEELGNNIFVNLEVSLSDPRNSVLIKDIVTKVLVQKIGLNMTNSDTKADTIMNLRINSIDFSTLQYDADGYNKLYKVVVVISVKYINKVTQKTKSFFVEAEYDFAVDIDANINDTQRYEAIKKASQKAITEILSKVAVLSFK